MRCDFEGVGMCMCVHKCIRVCMADVGSAVHSDNRHTHTYYYMEVILCTQHKKHSKTVSSMCGRDQRVNIPLNIHQHACARYNVHCISDSTSKTT